MAPGVAQEIEIASGQQNSYHLSGLDTQWAASEVDNMLGNMDSNNPELNIEEFVQMLMETTGAGATK